MVAKQLILKERSYYLFSDSVLLNEFDETKLKIARHDRVDRYIYHIDYVKDMNNVNLLYSIIPEFYGYFEEDNGRRYLSFALAEMNNEVLGEYDKMWSALLKKVNKINSSAYIFKKDYYRIKVGNIKCDDDKEIINLPLDKLLKFNAVTISNRLVIEKDNKLFAESYL